MYRVFIMLFVITMKFASASEMLFPIIDIQTQSLLGSLQGTTIHNAKSSYTFLKDSYQTDTFTLYHPTGYSETSLSLSMLEARDEEICSENIYAKTYTTAKNGIALSNQITWHPQPRVITALSTQNAIYKEIVRDILIKKGMGSPIVSLKHIYRTDLDNDGRDEIVIVGEQHTPTSSEGGSSIYAAVGDYSFVLVRTITKSGVKNIFLEESISLVSQENGGKITYTNEIVSILDLNGDGIMEVIVNNSYYEGSFTTAYAVENGEVKSLLSCGCGA